MTRVLVTGGCGYIGSHTLVELIEAGFDVVSLDSNVRSSASVLDGVRAITGREVRNHVVDLRDAEATDRVFAEEGGIDAIVHFAAFKWVAESVANPLLYYENNVGGLVNILRSAERHGVRDFVFSSSCSVYGNVAELPVTESTPLSRAEAPYAYTKQVGERMIDDVSKNGEGRFISLRYFNPVGAHSSALIGEVPHGRPENLVPAITQTAAGRLDQLVVHGDDYPTRDGTCIRDYIHVSDIAAAHVAAIDYLRSERVRSRHEIVNLGSGVGVSVREAIDAFERVTGVKLNYTIGPRRDGDIEAIYADNSLAADLLGWRPERGVEEMMETAWRWEVKSQK